MKKNYFAGFGEGESHIQNLKIKDEEYLVGAKEYDECAKELYKIYQNYLKTIENLAGQLEGDFSKNMVAFADKMRMYLNDSIKCIYRTLKGNMTAYIDEIDEADGKLF